MADNKQGRDKQAHDAERRQREREIQEELERMDDPEPPVDTSELAYFESKLESVSFPATGAEVVEAVGDHELDSAEGSYTVEELVPDTDAETFDSPAAVREQVQQPTVAAAMKRVLEASETAQGEKLSGSQYDAYRKTFLALKNIDADDDDEGIQAISDWIVERVHEKEKLPGSRAVRRQAAKFCRSEGYEIRDDEWLGI
jgi:hypothetical protein